MITNMITIYCQEREVDWDKETLGFLITRFQEGKALQTSTTPPNWPILSGELYPVAEGDMIQQNTNLQKIDTTTYHMRQVPILCTRHTEPGEVISLPGLGAEAINLDTLPLPRCQHHQAHLHLPTLHQYGVACPPLIKEAPHCQIKDKRFTINPCHKSPSVENQI